MSTNLAHALPSASPVQETHPRHIEIVSTRSQRRARPRPIYAVIIVGGLFVLFIAQLIMSIVVADGAYQISSLQQEQKELTRTEAALTEQNEILASPQNLSAAAEALGMGYSSKTPNFINLEAGKVVGSRSGPSSVQDPTRNGGIPNAVLDAKNDADKTAKTDTPSTTGNSDSDANSNPDTGTLPTTPDAAVAGGTTNPPSVQTR